MLLQRQSGCGLARPRLCMQSDMAAVAHPGGRCTTTAKTPGVPSTGAMGIVSTQRVKEPQRCTCGVYAGDTRQQQCSVALADATQQRTQHRPRVADIAEGLCSLWQYGSHPQTTAPACNQQARRRNAWPNPTPHLTATKSPYKACRNKERHVDNAGHRPGGRVARRTKATHVCS